MESRLHSQTDAESVFYLSVVPQNPTNVNHTQLMYSPNPTHTHADAHTLCPLSLSIARRLPCMHMKISRYGAKVIPSLAADRGEMNGGSI